MNRRLAIALCLAVIVTFTLFWLMQALVDRRPHGGMPDYVGMRLETLRLTEDPPRPPPEPPPRAEPPVAPPGSRAAPLPDSIAPPPLPTASVSLPMLAFKPALSGRPQTGNPLAGLAGGPGTGNDGDAPGEAFTGADLVPISSARPKYPRSAINRGIEGWVEIVFLIAADGTVDSVRIVNAEPRGVFEDAALAAVSKWIYAPFYRNGQPVRREAAQRLEFRLADVQPLYIWED